LLIEVIAIGAMPFVVRAFLGVVAHGWQLNLRATLPSLSALRWLIGMPLILVVVVGQKYFWLFPIGTSLTSASILFAPVEGWIQKRYAPELWIPESDGWWPTVRK